MRLKKIILWVFIILVVSVIGLGSYVYFNAQNIINQIVIENIIEKNNSNPSSKYKLTLEKVRVNLLAGSVKLINLTVQPKDSLVVVKNEMNKQVYANTSLIISIHEISLAGFDYITALNNRAIIAKSFSIESPKIQIYHHDGIKRIETEKVQDTVNIRNLFLAQFDTFMIDQISVTNAATNFYKISKKKDTSLIYTLENISYEIYGVLANKETLYSSRVFDYKSYKLKSKNIELLLPDESKIKIKRINYDSDVNQLKISKVSFQQKGTPTQFFKTLKHRKSWLKIAINEIIIDQLDIDKWLENDYVYASEIKISSPELSVFSNSKIPVDSNIVKPMLGEILKKIKLPYLIDNVQITDASINLDMLGKYTDKHGKLVFKDMNIVASNVTNIKSELDLNPYINIKVNTKINKTGDVNATLRINMKSASSLTNYNVNATNLELKNFSTVLKPILRVSIKSGVIKSLKIKSIISNQGGFGTMDAHYTELKIQLENKELADKPGIFNNLASGIANGVLKKNNIPETKDYHQGNISFKKKASDSFFKMLWVVTLYGLEDSILGSDNRDQRRINKKQRKEKKKKKKKRFKWGF